MKRTLVLTAILLALAAGHAFAQWPPAGVRVLTPENGFNGVRGVRLLDFPNGELAVVGIGSGGNSYGYTLQRVNRLRGVVSGWPADGVSLWQWSKSNDPNFHGWIADDSCNVWHSFTTASNGRLHVVTPSGLPVPSAISPWSVSGSGPSRAHVAVGPPGSAYFSPANGKVQRLLRSGLIAPGWSPVGVALGSTGYGNTELIDDGQGGVIGFGFNGLSGSSAYVQRIDSTSARNAAWPVGGLTLSNDVDGDLASSTPLSLLLPSSADTRIAAWLAYDPANHLNGRRRLIAQRFRINATLDPAWPTSGVTVIALDSISAVTTLPDGAGGLFALWLERGVPRGTHLLAHGQFAPGLDAEGVSLVDAGAQYVHAQYNPGAVAQDQLCAGVNRFGHLLFAWSDARLSPLVSYRVRWLASDLTVLPGCPDAGLLFQPTNDFASATGLLGVTHDGGASALLVWAGGHATSTTSPYGTGDVWMARLEAPPLLDAPPAAAPTGRIRLAAPRPNPARERAVLAFTLPTDAREASVELLDVAGRVTRVQHVSGSGRHEVAFEDLSTIAPGLYFARVRAAGVMATVRLAITR